MPAQVLVVTCKQLVEQHMPGSGSVRTYPALVMLVLGGWGKVLVRVIVVTLPCSFVTGYVIVALRSALPPLPPAPSFSVLPPPP